MQIRIAQNSPGNGLSVDDSTYLQERGVNGVSASEFQKML